MQMKTFTTHRLIKSEDLNHHGTLFAGRGAEWFVEAGFIAAASLARPENVVCLQIHGLVFTRPVQLGELVCYESKVAYTGRSKIVAYVRVDAGEHQILDGFITFVHVDASGRSQPHGIVIEPANAEEKALQQRAMALFTPKSQ